MCSSDLVMIRRLGIPDEYIEHATQAELRAQYGLDEEGIYRALKSMMASAMP